MMPNMKKMTNQNHHGRDETVWNEVPVHRDRHRRFTTRSALHKVHLAPGQHIDTPNDAFGCFFVDSVINAIMRFTNIEGQRVDPRWKPSDEIEYVPSLDY